MVFQCVGEELVGCVEYREVGAPHVPGLDGVGGEAGGGGDAHSRFPLCLGGVGKEEYHLGAIEIVALFAEECEEAVALAAECGVAQLLALVYQSLGPFVVYEAVHLRGKSAILNLAIVPRLSEA